MSDIILFAVGLVFVLEGILPFLAPNLWRKAMLHMVGQPERSIRIFGLSSMLIGLIIVYIVHISIS